MDPFVHLDTCLAGMIEEQGIETGTGEPKRSTPRLSDPKISEKTMSAWRVDEHCLHAVRAQSLEVAGKSQLGEQSRSCRVDVLGARLVAWKARFIEEQDAVTALGEEPGRDTSSGTTPDDDDVRIELRHIRSRVCDAPPPCGRGDAW